MAQTLNDGPIVVRDFLDVETHSEIKEYVLNNFKYLPKEPDHLFGRTGIHNSSFFVSIHRQLIEVASEIFGEEVKPSYVYLSMYKDGGRCPIHIDRDPCRYTIDYLIHQEQKDPWPLCISGIMTDIERERALDLNHAPPKDTSEFMDIYNANEWETVLLNENDSACYTGTHSWHYRPTTLEGEATLAFFHFVPIQYSGGLS